MPPILKPKKRKKAVNNTNQNTNATNSKTQKRKKAVNNTNQKTNSNNSKTQKRKKDVNKDNINKANIIKVIAESIANK